MDEFQEKAETDADLARTANQLLGTLDDPKFANSEVNALNIKSCNVYFIKL